MSKQRDTNSYFQGVLENINIILNNNLYKDIDKENLKFIKLKIENWYESYKENKTLKGINPNLLKSIDTEITDFFEKYIVTEPIKENYAERLSYDFGCLEKHWEIEMLGGK